MPVVLRIPILLVLVVAGALLAVAVHEAGHALGGRLAGMRLSLFTVGPLRLGRGPDGRMRWGLNRDLGAAGGVVVSVARQTARLRRAILFLAAGGPVASMVGAVLALGAYVWLDMGALTWTGDGALKGVAAGVFTFGAASLAMAAGTAVPYRANGLASDGRRVLTLLHRGPAAERHAALAALGGWSADGRPPRTWDPAVVERALAAGDDGSFDAVLARYLAYVHALDREDPDAAAAHVRAMTAQADRAPAVVRPLIDAEAAYFDAGYGGGDPAAARARLAGAGTSPLLDAHTRRRAEVAVLLAGEDAARGREQLRAFYGELVGRGARPGADFQLDELRRLARSRGLPDPAGATLAVTT